MHETPAHLIARYKKAKENVRSLGLGYAKTKLILNCMIACSLTCGQISISFGRSRPTNI